MVLDPAGAVVFAVGVNNQTSIWRLDAADGKAVRIGAVWDSTPSWLAVDGKGNLYLTGSAGPGFATTSEAFLRQSGCLAGETNCRDAFALKLSPAGVVVYATLLGSGAGHSIAADSVGRSWVTGSRPPVPVPRGSTRTDSFLIRLEGDGRTAKTVDTYVGGRAYGVSVDGGDGVFVTGAAPEFGRPGSLLTFLAKYDAQGTPIGSMNLGNTFGLGNWVGIDSDGNAYQGIGQTLLVVRADGKQVLARSLLRGYASAMALDGKGGVVVTGGTQATAFVATADAYITQYPGGSNAAFVERLDVSKAGGLRLARVVNAASLQAGRNSRGEDGSIAPGEIVTLFGENFPAGVEVTFDGKPAPILYADAGQINTVVPVERSSAEPLVLVSVAGTGFRLPWAPAAPGIFLFEGYAAENPAPAGSVVSLYLTGAGVLDPAPVMGVSATIAAGRTQGMDVLFAGQAPGLLGGVVQVNVRIPADVPEGPATVTVYVGNYPAPARIFVGPR